MSTKLKELFIFLSAFIFLACSQKEINPYDEMFSDTNKFVPINTKEFKEVK